jgi:hypothetical protein
MKTIIEIKTSEIVSFNERDLPMVVHGEDHSGASLMSVTIAAKFHSQGSKLCIFTAYPMARKEFLSQINTPEVVFYLENEEAFDEANRYQTVIIPSGDIGLFMKFISQETEKQRILFIKNIETIHIKCLHEIKPFKFVVSGDLEANPQQLDFKSVSYATEILFSALEGRTLPDLEKYQGYMKRGDEEKVISIQ